MPIVYLLYPTSVILGILIFSLIVQIISFSMLANQTILTSLIIITIIFWNLFISLKPLI